MSTISDNKSTSTPNEKVLPSVPQNNSNNYLAIRSSGPAFLAALFLYATLAFAGGWGFGLAADIADRQVYLLLNSDEVVK